MSKNEGEKSLCLLPECNSQHLMYTISIASGNMACGKNKYALLLDYVYDKKG